jgi:SAM-dependent methyltransferase
MACVNEYMEANRRHWDELVPIHEASSFYDVPSFRQGRSTLLPVEKREVGSVRGKTLLHLLCHFGLDTMSWSREGATVTGADFSHPAIATARLIALQQGIEARFIHCDLYDLEQHLGGSFDVVFMSYGVVNWLPDLKEWARIAARYTKPGGFVYLVDFHPLTTALDDRPDVNGMSLAYPYFGTGQPTPWSDDGSYADRLAHLDNRTTYEFTHDLGEIVTSLIDAGLYVEFLHEYPFAAYAKSPTMIRGDDGYYYPPADAPSFPYTFSIKATKL